MSPIEKDNRATMQRWYNEMWGKTDSSRIKDCIAPEYLRHDVTGANNIVTVDSYAAMTKAGMEGKIVNDFTYYMVVEGEYIGTLGRYLFGDGEQWDWVQLFRLEKGRLAETWLPGMGGNETRAFPVPVNAWSGTEIPDQKLIPMTDTKRVVKNWYEHLAAGTDASECLTEAVRVHDMLDSDITLEAVDFHKRWRFLMQHETACDLKLLLIEENDIVFATGMWSLGDDKREWNWVQAFRLEDGRIAQTWITSIGGTDSFLTHSSEPLWSRDVLPVNSTRLGAMVPATEHGIQT